ncbi:uncharacterized protein NEMAJ01_0462 [Nematocida major]|uniref:uncharacterized protein n=1 Tax=Nematocida major TaxID=1912982 RepID=UPI0020075F30|nr:uncharacterized protein NEMAJ01_0462 [Nematocida major]KAH9385566.1 hypothetical protein NEMAJ01_0462 [Nematocida major]
MKAGGVLVFLVQILAGRLAHGSGLAMEAQGMCKRTCELSSWIGNVNERERMGLLRSVENTTNHLISDTNNAKSPAMICVLKSLIGFAPTLRERRPILIEHVRHLVSCIECYYLRPIVAEDTGFLDGALLGELRWANFTINNLWCQQSDIVSAILVYFKLAVNKANRAFMCLLIERNAPDTMGAGLKSLCDVICMFFYLLRFLRADVENVEDLHIFVSWKVYEKIAGIDMCSESETSCFSLENLPS